MTLDLQSNDVYLDGPPWEAFAAARRDTPIFRHPGMNPHDPEWFWAITRHADVVTVSRQFQNYSSARKGVIMSDDRQDLDVARMLIDIDPPEHTRLRGLVNRGFTPRATRLLADHYVDVTKRIIDEALEEGDVEFVTKVAAELPLIAIAELLGIPPEDRHMVFDWSNRLIGTTDPDYSGGPDDGVAAAAELYVYAQALADDRRRTPREDIISILVGAEDGDQLSEHEFNLFVLMLSVAGNETTRNAISHGVLAFIEHPAQWQRLREHPDMVDSAVEEVLRWGSSVNLFRRTATCDLELHGQQISENDAVVMFYASANRDEAVFADPHRFDIGRDPNPHVAFGGGGPHFCLGSNLARLEMRTVFHELATRCTALELTGEVHRLRSCFINGIKDLPVRLVPA